MSKKLLSAILGIFLMAIVLVGCGSKPAESDNNAPAPEAEGIAVATAEEVAAAIKDGTAIVVDARSNEAYAGWATGGNTFGGHIAGATDFSANWLTATFDDQNNLNGMTREEHLQKYLADKNIKADSSVIVYDENGTDAAAVAEYFASQGIADLKTFNLADWKEELVTYANYQLYIPPAAVNDLIQGKEVTEVGAVKDLKILEISWGTAEQSGYLSGHVPGALHVNSDDFDDENNVYMLESDETLFSLAESLGITTESTVICTGNPIFSTRMAVILEYLGVDNVYVMSGGTTGWTDAGFELETAEIQPMPVADFGAATPKNPDLIDTVAEVQEKRSDANFVLVDNRTEEEFRGETSGYSYFDMAGRIEGAVYGFAGVGNSSSMLYYENLDSTMRNAYEIEAMWAAAGIDTAKHLSFYCGGGYRAAEVLWHAKVMGLENVSLFADGWCGWALAGLDYVTGE